MVIGEAGVGKTAIAEGIAQQIVGDDVPESLAGKRFVGLNLRGMVAGTRYRGEFEERMGRLVRRMAERRIDLHMTDDAVDHLAEAGYDPEFGARTLQRVVQQVENELSRMILNGSLAEGDAERGPTDLRGRVRGLPG